MRALIYLPNIILIYGGKLKIYLDDLRIEPKGWRRTYTVEETIELLKTRQVEELSLDNDLGDGLQEGFRVLDFLEEVIFNDPTFPIPKMNVHSSNEGRAPSMRKIIKKLEMIRQTQTGDS